MSIMGLLSRILSASTRMSNIDLFRKAAREKRISEFDHVAKSTYKQAELKPRKLKIKIGRKVGEGQNVVVYKPPTLGRVYGRRRLCLKIFKNSNTVWGYPGTLGMSKIVESTIVQNLMAVRGLAPRVYELVEVGGKVAQVTDYVTGKPTHIKITDERFKFNVAETTQPHNQIGGKLLDFQGAIFNDYHETKRKLLNRAHTHTSFPRTEMQLYQTTDYCGGKRDTKRRLKEYKFPSFKGQTVFDIGCNLGMLMREAYDKGALRVVGLDWPDMVDVSREVSILDGYFNLDFVGGDIKKLTWPEIQKLTGIEKFDVHFYFAMEMWVGWPDWVKNANTIYYEGHGVVRPYEVMKKY